MPCFGQVSTLYNYYETYLSRRLRVLQPSISIKKETYKKSTNIHALHLIFILRPLHFDKSYKSKRKTPIYSFKGSPTVFGFLRSLPIFETKIRAITIKHSGWSTQFLSAKVSNQLVEVVRVLYRLNSNTYFFSSSLNRTS